MPRFKKSKYMALACVARTDQLVSVFLEMEPIIGEELLCVANDAVLANQVFLQFHLNFYLVYYKKSYFVFLRRPKFSTYLC